MSRFNVEYVTVDKQKLERELINLILFHRLISALRTQGMEEWECYYDAVSSTDLSPESTKDEVSELIDELL